MSSGTRWVTIVVAVGVFFLAGLGLGLVLAGRADTGSAAKVSDDTLSVRVTGEPLPAFRGKDGDWGFADVVATVTPAVVNVFSERVVVTRDRIYSPFWSDPFFDLFGRRYQTIPRERRETSLGSGVLVDASGVILTNNHVIEGAQEIKVALADGRQFVARLLGSDPATDIAVLKVAGESLPWLPFGDSDSARIGDLVLAIGNPFGIGQTVTMGIISATGRYDVGVVDYENFIQTDAAINPGNSGGALVDPSGRLIGINTAIFSRSGGYQGIGFAVPSNMARAVMQSILTTGTIARGTLGFGFQNLDQGLMRAFGLDALSGALVNEITPQGPAEKAGLKRGDVVLEFNGQKILDAADLRRRIALAQVGSQVSLTIRRTDETRTLTLTVGEMTTQFTYLSQGNQGWVSPIEGVVVEVLDRRSAERAGLRAGTLGVIVKDILDQSPAAISGLRTGDVILEINREPVGSVDAFRLLVEKYEGKNVILLVSRFGRLYYLSLPS